MVPFMAFVRFFHIGVGHNFYSNFLEEERGRKKEILKSYTVDVLVTADINTQNETDHNYKPPVKFEMTIKLLK